MSYQKGRQHDKRYIFTYKTDKNSNFKQVYKEKTEQKFEDQSREDIERSFKTQNQGEQKKQGTDYWNSSQVDKVHTNTVTVQIDNLQKSQGSQQDVKEQNVQLLKQSEQGTIEKLSNTDLKSKTHFAGRNQFEQQIMKLKRTVEMQQKIIEQNQITNSMLNNQKQTQKRNNQSVSEQLKCLRTSYTSFVKMILNLTGQIMMNQKLLSATQDKKQIKDISASENKVENEEQVCLQKIIVEVKNNLKKIKQNEDLILKRVNQEYQANISLGNQISILREQLINHQTNNTQLKAQNREVQAKNQEFNSKNIKLDQELSTYSKQIDNMVTKIDSLQKQNKNFQLKIQQLEAKGTWSDHNYKINQKKLLHEINSQRENFQALLQTKNLLADDYVSCTNKINQLYDQTDRLVQDLQQKNIMLIQMQEEFIKHEIQIDEKNQQLAELEHICLTAKIQLLLKSKDIQKYQSQLRQCEECKNKQIQQLQSNYQNIISSIQSNLSRVTRENEQRIASFIKICSDNHQAVYQAKRSISEEDKLTGQFMLNKLRQKMETQIQEKSDMMAANQLQSYLKQRQLSKRISQQESTIKKLQLQIQSKNMMVQSSAAQSQKDKKWIKDLESIIEQSKLYQSKIYSNIDSQKNFLQVVDEASEVETNFEYIQRLNDLMRAVAYRQTVKQNSQQQRGEYLLEIQVKKTIECQKKHTRQLETLNEKISHLQSQNVNYKRNIDSLTLKIQSSQTELREKTQNNQDQKISMTNRMKQRQEQLKKYKQQLNSKFSQQDLDVFKRQSIKLKNDLQQAQVQIQSHKKQLAYNENRCKELSQKCDQMSYEQIDTSMKLQAQIEKNKELQQQIEELKKYLDRMKEQTIQLNKINAEIQQRVSKDRSTQSQAQARIKSRYEAQLRQNQDTIKQLQEANQQLQSQIQIKVKVLSNKISENDYQEMKLELMNLQIFKGQVQTLQQQNQKLVQKIKRLQYQAESAKKSQLTSSKSSQNIIRLSEAKSDIFTQSKAIQINIFSIAGVLTNATKSQLGKMIEDVAKKEIKQTRLYYKFEEYCKGYSLNNVKTELNNEAFVFLIKSKDNVFAVLSCKLQNNPKPSSTLFSINNLLTINRKLKNHVESSIEISAEGEISIGNKYMKIKCLNKLITVKENKYFVFEGDNKKGVFGKEAFRDDFTLELEMLEIHKITFRS